MVDNDLQPVRDGELLVTSFTTHGTPLIRYKIGDSIALAPEGSRCSCGWSFPIVESIDGRSSDFIWSPELGKVNLGNLSNVTKGIPGITSFQILQDDPNVVVINIVGTDAFSATAETDLIAALRVRLGLAMEISIRQVPSINREKSGKFRIVKNSLQPQQMLLASSLNGSSTGQ